MKKVAVMGLIDWENYGEQFLGNTVAYLIGSEYEVKSIDFRPKKNKIRYLFYCFTVILTRIFSFWNGCHRIVYGGVKLWVKQYYKKQLKDCDSIVFACGSYKYGTQRLWAFYSVVIEVASALQIPVMFNAANIQDFDESDWRCMCLKEHTNADVVKMFTTRDGDYGLQKLRTDYLQTNSGIMSDAVGDPAFWIPECYNKARQIDSNKIGVNLIRPGVFADYGLNITEEEVIEIYCDLIKRLEQEHVTWELFTNGLDVDLNVGKTILQRLGMESVSIVVPQSAEHLVDLITGYRGIIGARLHACICAYSLDVPMVSFVWDEKMLRFAEIADLQKRFLLENELTGDALYDCLMEHIDKSYNVKKREQWKAKTRESIAFFLTNNM